MATAKNTRPAHFRPDPHIRTTKDAVVLGQFLLKAKHELNAGNYLVWLQREFGGAISRCTSLRCMQVAARFAGNDAALKLPLSVAYRLARPSLPDEECAAAIVLHLRRPRTSERQVEQSVAAYLRSKGIRVERQVVCSVGRADLVTPGAVIEIEHILTSHALFCAIGQVLIYRQAILPKRSRAIVAGLLLPDYDYGPIKACAANLGVEIWPWEL